MLPQIVGPGTFTPSPFAPSAAERTLNGAQPSVGETAAAATRPETANRVDPPRVLPASLPLPEEKRRAETLLPPDPEAPSGPPPAFDATPLERVREAAFATVDPSAPTPAPRPGGSDTDRSALPDPVGAPGNSSPVADAARTEGPRRPSPGDDLRGRVEAEVAEVRRMAEPEPEHTLDVMR